MYEQGLSLVFALSKLSLSSKLVLILSLALHLNTWPRSQHGCHLTSCLITYHEDLLPLEVKIIYMEIALMEYFTDALRVCISAKLHAVVIGLNTTALQDWALYRYKTGHYTVTRLGTIPLQDWALYRYKIGHYTVTRLGTIPLQDWALYRYKTGHYAVTRLGTIPLQDWALYR